MAGYADKGFIYEIVGPKTIGQSNLFWRTLASLLNMDLEQWGYTQGRVTRRIPFFRLSNYTAKEQVGMRKLHPHPGGELRKSLYTQISMVGTNKLRIRIGWKTPYLQYLLSHGRTREKGTTLNFVQKIYSMGIFRIRILQHMKKAARLSKYPNYKRLKIHRKGMF